MRQTNKKLHEFIGNQEIDCICDLFEFDPDKVYLQKVMGERSWIEYLLDNALGTNEVLMDDKDGEPHIFDVQINHFENDLFVVSFQDVTKFKELQIELKQINENLEIKVQKALKENIKQLEILQQQSKLASMGEMIGSIAHQWRQPLNALSIHIQNLEEDYEEGLIDAAFVETFIETNRKIINFMSKTIDDFRNFFRIDKQKMEFSIKEVVDEIANMQTASLKNANISLMVEGEDFRVNGFKSEFAQTLLNIINNAKDAILQNGVKYGKVRVLLQDRKITIEDNAGGIPEDVIQRVFEPYFTTKEQGKGTGIGLYLTKMIVEDNMGGKITVKNAQDGAIFEIDLQGV
jgi:signal transduction histidine kinase